MKKEQFRSYMGLAPDQCLYNPVTAQHAELVAIQSNKGGVQVTIKIVPAGEVLTLPLARFKPDRTRIHKDKKKVIEEAKAPPVSNGSHYPGCGKTIEMTSPAGSKTVVIMRCGSVYHVLGITTPYYCTPCQDKANRARTVVKLPVTEPPPIRQIESVLLNGMTFSVGIADREPMVRLFPTIKGIQGPALQWGTTAFVAAIKAGEILVTSTRPDKGDGVTYCKCCGTTLRRDEEKFCDPCAGNFAILD